MMIRTRLIATSILMFAFSAAAFAQTASQSVKKPSAATRHSSSGPRYSDEVTAPASDSPQLVTRSMHDGVLPTGTAIRVKLANAISTRDSNLGDPFTATVTDAVIVDGKTVFPKGATLTGKIARIGEPRRIAGRPWVELRPETVTTSDGHAVTISAVAVDTSQPRKYTVSEQGRIAGPTYKKTTAAGTGALAGSGALAGALIAGPFGSLVGAGAGATVGTGHYFVSHHSLTIPADLEVVFEISSTTPESAGQN